ncbi:MAG: hypothetical protein ACI4RG_01265 [Huintestinicola sp.]
MKMLKRHELNLYLKYREDPKKKRRRREFASAFFPAVIIVLLIIFSAVSLKIQERSLTEQIALQRAAAEERRDTAAAASGYISAANIFHAETDRISLFKLIRDSYPVIGTNEIETVLSCSSPDMSVTDISCSRSEGKMVFTLQVRNVENIPDYVRRLKATELFSQVTYSGYSQKADGSYTVEAVMKRQPVYDDSSFYGYINESVKNR